MDTERQAVGERVRTVWREHPRRLAAVAVTVVVLAGLVIALLGQVGPRWQRYNLEAIGLAIDLPNKPTAEPAGREGDAGTLYRTSTPHLSLIVSGGTIPGNVPAQPASMVEQAMKLVQDTEGIEHLEYQVTEKQIGGHPCLHVSGVFALHGTPARLTGMFFTHTERHAHAICFYSTKKGAQAANRVLTSIRFPEADAQS